MCQVFSSILAEFLFKFENEYIKTTEVDIGDLF